MSVLPSPEGAKRPRAKGELTRYTLTLSDRRLPDLGARSGDNVHAKSVCSGITSEVTYHLFAFRMTVKETGIV